MKPRPKLYVIRVNKDYFVSAISRGLDNQYTLSRDSAAIFCEEGLPNASTVAYHTGGEMIEVGPKEAAHD